MPHSSDENLDQVVLGLLEKDDLRKILSSKKDELHRQIHVLSAKFKNVCKILKSLSAQNPESSILMPAQDKKRSRKAGRKSRSMKTYRGVKLSGASALTANILKSGRSFSKEQIQKTLVKQVKEGGHSARGVHLTLKRVLAQPDFQKTASGKWRLANRHLLEKNR